MCVHMCVCVCVCAYVCVRMCVLRGHHVPDFAKGTALSKERDVEVVRGARKGSTRTSVMSET